MTKLPKKKKWGTYPMKSFRPSVQCQRVLEEAQRITGKSCSYLINTCLSKNLLALAGEQIRGEKQ